MHKIFLLTCFDIEIHIHAIFFTVGIFENLIQNYSYVLEFFIKSCFVVVPIEHRLNFLVWFQFSRG